MIPTTFRSGSARDSIRFAVDACSLGSVLIAATEQGICAILLGDDPGGLARELHGRFPKENGELAGYRWGVERKRTVLEREAAQA
jgi:AraC family transcriptional regulator of adaptative response/methylated-DNA-[protein]-cysteine methyltransferase